MYYKTYSNLLIEAVSLNLGIIPIRAWIFGEEYLVQTISIFGGARPLHCIETKNTIYYVSIENSEQISEKDFKILLVRQKLEQP